MGQHIEKSAADTKLHTQLHTKEQPLNQFVHEADKACHSMMHEVQQDLQKAGDWVKSHPKEDGMIVGGCMVIAGIALAIKDAKDGAAAIAEGNRLMRGEQVLSEATTFAKTGSEGGLTTTIKFGNLAKDNLWVDPASGVGRRLLDQGVGLGGSLPKEGLTWLKPLAKEGAKTATGLTDKINAKFPL